MAPKLVGKGGKVGVDCSGWVGERPPLSYRYAAEAADAGPASEAAEGALTWSAASAAPAAELVLPPGRFRLYALVEDSQVRGWSWDQGPCRVAVGSGDRRWRLGDGVGKAVIPRAGFVPLPRHFHGVSPCAVLA